MYDELRNEAECPDNYPEDSALMREAAEGGTRMSRLKNCENCKHRKIRRSRGYPCMCCELLNPISFNLKWEEEPPKQGEKK